MNNTKDHQKLVDEILWALGSRPEVRLWIRVVGFDEKTKVTYGIPGETDIDGIVGPHGFRIAIEVKTGSAKLSQKQELWKKMIESKGGIHIEARSVEQCVEEFDSKLKKKIDDLASKKLL